MLEDQQRALEQCLVIRPAGPSGTLSPDDSSLGPDGMPAAVRISWPPQSTIVNPKQFPDVAAAIAQLFARAHIVLAALTAGKQL